MTDIEQAEAVIEGLIARPCRSHACGGSRGTYRTGKTYGALPKAVGIETYSHDEELSGFVCNACGAIVGINERH